MRIRALATAVLVSGVLAVASPATAQDERPCVSKAEYYGLKSGQTRAQVEDRWEVHGTATRGRYRVWVTYPYCESSVTRPSSVTVSYANESRLWQTEMLAILI